MRDPQRIGPVIAELVAVWRRYLALRLGEVVALAVAASKSDLFAIEDDELRAGLADVPTFVLRIKAEGMIAYLDRYERSDLRDPQRIEPLIAELVGVWRRYPDLRLGQLIALAVADSGAHLLTVGDDELHAALREVPRWLVADRLVGGVVYVDRRSGSTPMQHARRLAAEFDAAIEEQELGDDDPRAGADDSA